MITIVDCGVGNLGSLLNMMKKIGVETIVSSRLPDIEKAEKLILPGVGSFDSGIKNLDNSGMIPILNRRVIEEKIPLLGVCLGMQLLTKKSEEGKLSGLGWIDAETVKFEFNENRKDFKIPHMGWGLVNLKKDSALFRQMYQPAKFYFAHSYHVICYDKENILASTDYGYEFTSVVQKKNIFGVQFHPEKSHKYGLRLLDNFVKLT